MDILDGAQADALAAVLAGKNTFITGPAGVGKSWVLNIIKEELKGKVAMTATTGVAAVNVSGATIHSWAGLGLGKDSVAVLVERLQKQIKFSRWNKKKTGTDDCAGNRVLRTKTLVIDEVSMLSHALFVKFEEVCRKIRKNNSSPFGGMQVIVVGDFFQLPPVHKDKQLCEVCGADAIIREDDGLYECTVKQDWRCRNKKWDGRLRFCFDDSRDGKSNLWNRCNFVFVELTEVHRQTDPVFIEILHRIRVGKHTPEDVTLINDRCGEDNIDVSDGIIPTELYCHNIDVDKMNMTEYRKLPTDSQEMIYEGVPLSKCTLVGSKDHGREVPDSRLLKMLTKNCQAPGELPLRVGAQVTLLYNLDISSGLCNGTRGCVTGFVRAVSEMGDPPKETSVRQEATAVWYWPKVKFVRADGSHIVTVVKPHTWKLDTSVEEATYVQIPLRHAWAITVHKSQGMSLSKVRMHLGDAFSEGQVYVAISRATGMTNTHVPDFDPSLIKVNKDVVAFYERCRAERSGDAERDVKHVIEDVDDEELVIKRCKSGETIAAAAAWDAVTDELASD